MRLRFAYVLFILKLYAHIRSVFLLSCTHAFPVHCLSPSFSMEVFSISPVTMIFEDSVVASTIPFFGERALNLADWRNWMFIKSWNAFTEQITFCVSICHVTVDEPITPIDGRSREADWQLFIDGSSRDPTWYPV